MAEFQRPRSRDRKGFSSPLVVGAVCRSAWVDCRVRYARCQISAIRIDADLLGVELSQIPLRHICQELGGGRMLTIRLWLPARRLERSGRRSAGW